MHQGIQHTAFNPNFIANPETKETLIPKFPFYR